MDTPRWLLGVFFGIQLLEPTAFAGSLAFSVPDEFVRHGTQYRFQYFVRDERGDYKTQEEAGEGGNARGSYAVEEPDGDLRIVQYTADLGGGFKAHIKVDHAGKSSSKLQEIDIPADEMRKLLSENRKKTTAATAAAAAAAAAAEVTEPRKSSKSYALGPPRKMSDIVMEQAAAIREIISKEIEAEEKREAEENLRSERTASGNQGRDVVDCEKENLGEESVAVTKSGGEPTGVATSDVLTAQRANVRTAKARKIEVETRGDESPENSGNSEASGLETAPNGVEGTNAGPPKVDELQSPVVRVALSPGKGIPRDAQGAEAKEKNPREYSGREAYVGTPDPALVGPLLGGPVRNFSFKNRIMFFKPAERKPGSNPSEESMPDAKYLVESNAGPIPVSFDGQAVETGDDREQIVLYSPYDEGDSQAGPRRGRYIKVPYEVLRPYFASAKTPGEEKTEEKSETRK